MLRERYSKVEFEKIFQSFNEAVYRGEMKRLNYKSWRNIKNWLSDEKWSKMEVSKEWARIRDDTNSYAYHDEERIFVGPYDDSLCCPNPEELRLDDNSFGTWLNGVMEDYNTALDYSNVSVSAVSAVDAITTYGYNTRETVSTRDQCIPSILQDWQPYTIDLNADGVRINGGSLKEYIEKIIINNNKKEEENNKMMKFDFGPVDSSVHMSLYGMAIKNASGTYVAYDAKTSSIMDVDILNFEGANKFMYKMPVAVKDVAVGDIVVHMHKPMIVLGTYDDGTFAVVDVYNGEEKIIISATSPFGWNFMTKVVSFVNFGSADASNPFGNMLPLLLLSDSKSKDDNLLPLMLMASGNMDMSNPMMMYALMGNRTNDPMMLMLAMGAFNKPAAHTCACGGNCGHTEAK